MYCRVCRAYPSVSNPSATLVKGVTGNFRRETLKFHNMSGTHGLCETMEANDKNPQQAPMQRMVKKLNIDNEAKMKVLFKTAFYIAKEKDSFNKFGSRLTYAESLGVDVGQRYRSGKNCRKFVESIAAVEEDRGGR